MPYPRNASSSRAVALELDACMACGQVCEVTGAFQLPGLDGLERYVRTRCVVGHVLMGPEFALRAPRP